MKHILLISFAILLHIITRTFWDIGWTDPNDKFQAMQAANRYISGFSLVMLTWVYSYYYQLKNPPSERLRKKLNLISSTWLFFVVGDVCKEIARTTNTLTDFFYDPTKKYWFEYVIFGLATIYVIWKIKISRQ